MNGERFEVEEDEWLARALRCVGCMNSERSDLNSSHALTFLLLRSMRGWSVDRKVLPLDNTSTEPI